MTAPRTIAGRAALSAMRPYVQRALGQTIVAIETQAIAPYREALQNADRVLESLVALDATAALDDPSRLELVRHADAAHRKAAPLLASPAD